jgi:hypothetical protein
LAAWVTIEEEGLPKPLYAHAAVAVNDHIYVLSGYSGYYERTVYMATINPDGSLGAWQVASNGLPPGQERATHATVVFDNYLYVLGGLDSTGASLASVWRAPIQSDGDLGPWVQEDESLPVSLFRCGVIRDGNSIIVTGGRSDEVADLTLRRIYRTTLQADGHLSQWQNLGDLLPEGRAEHIALVDQGKLYVIGGTNGVAPQATVFVYEISAAGLIPLPPDRPLPRPRMRAAGAVSGNHAIYVLGGLDGTAQQNTVYMARVATPGLTLSLTSDRHGPLRWGDELEYRIGFQNGPAWLENVTITNTLPIISTGAITVTGISFGGRQEGDQVRWPPWPVLAPGWTAELTYTVRLSATVPASPASCGDATLVNPGAYAAWTYAGQRATSRSESFIHGCTLYAPLIWP